MGVVVVVVVKEVSNPVRNQYKVSPTSRHNDLLFSPQLDPISIHSRTEMLPLAIKTATTHTFIPHSLRYPSSR